MLSILEITIALIIGILWGLYLEIKFLFVTSIFLFILVLMFYNKYIFKCVILLTIVVISFFYTKVKIEVFDTKYIDDSVIDMEVTIITHLEETEYKNKYYAKNEQGDKFILYFKKNENTFFKIGDSLTINGKFNLPDTERNNGGFNYRRYLNSNGIYGTILVSSLKKYDKDNFNLVYVVQNLVYENFQKILSKEEARSTKRNTNTVKLVLYLILLRIIFRKLELLI